MLVIILPTLRLQSCRQSESRQVGGYPSVCGHKSAVKSWASVCGHKSAVKSCASVCDHKSAVMSWPHSVVPHFPRTHEYSQGDCQTGWSGEVHNWPLEQIHFHHSVNNLNRYFFFIKIHNYSTKSMLETFKLKAVQTSASNPRCLPVSTVPFEVQ